jgi:hypothetical protein
LFNMGTFATLGSSWTGADNRNRREALFLQDRWSANTRVTITAGVRYDRQRPYYEASKAAPVLSDIFQPGTTPGATLLVRNSVAPRVGLSWDLQGDGKAAVKAFYGRYYNNMAQDLANLNPGGVNSKTYKFIDLNGNGLYDGQSELGTLVSTTGGTTTKLDTSVKVPYTDEADASYQRQFWGESSIRVAYVRKMVRNLYATFNILRDGQFTVPFTTTVPLSSVGGLSQGSQTFNLEDIPSSLRGSVQNQFANIPDSIGGGSYNYDTFELAFNKRFSGSQFLDASFDYLRRDELRQNTASSNPFSTDPLGINYFQNVNPTVSNRQTSSNWQFHLSGRYELPLGIGFGGNVQVQSGWPFARLITVSLPNAGTQTFFQENIGNNRSDTVPLVGLRADKAVHFDTHKILFMFDVFNALNSNAVTNFALANGSSYNKIIATLQPRTIQIGARLDF